MERRLLKMTILVAFLVACTLDSIAGQALTPPNFNLAVRRQIEATATCGKGVSEPELFCKLTGANPDKDDLIGDFEVIQGQLCDYCDAREPSKTHDPENAVDGTEKWWQSPPLSRGLQFNEVNLTISLGQVFHVAYVFIKMANSPRPGVFALERSDDYGITWRPWQYFADTPSDCQNFFGKSGYSSSISRDDSVICTTDYSKVVPLEGGEIVISLVNNRPSANNFSYSQSLQDWTRASNIRLRLLRTKTLLGHLMAVARQDPTVTRRYYYSIKDISIGGRCVCNGHADSCDMNDPRDQTKLICRCQHYTCGEQCDRCCPGYVQKPWRPATVDAENACEPCQCNGHATECRYDEEVARNRGSMDIHGNMQGGGVCLNCQHNTAGVNCETCSAGYYRPFNVPINSSRVCQRCRCDTSFSTGSCEEGTGRCICRPEYGGVNCDRCNVGYYGFPRCIPCLCHVNGTQGQVCEVGGGQCPCKPNFDGYYCDQCANGYYNFPECIGCNCDRIGSAGRSCEVKSGQCRCRQNFGGRNCGQCAAGYYNYPACEQCNCDPNGCTSEVCNPDTSSCTCKPNFSGSRCDRCAPGFYKYPQCIPCGCSATGMQVNDCDRNGQCICKPNFTGRTCEQCAAGYHHYPQCQPCNCDAYGSYGISCDQQTGQCDCQPTFEGVTCNKCRPSFYNYPYCEECSCDPAGAKDVPGFPLGGCGANVGGLLCECKDRVAGRLCDSCKPSYWNLRITNRDGCEDCGCNTGGTIAWSRACDLRSGQCVCRPLVNSRRCDQCVEGTYNLQSHDAFGCQACDCDVGGSQDQNCNKATGACTCKPRVNGRRCNSPIATHYFPTMYHDMYELEDGHTPTGGAVRYGFDNRQFSGYSWRGYAVFSKIQGEVRIEVDVRKPSLYRIVYRYVNPTDRAIVAEVLVTPESTSSELPQSSRVLFDSTRQPQFVTASEGPVLSTFVLNPGLWTFALKTPAGVLVDYMVLLPEAYYGATILQQKVVKPCTVPSTGGLCRHYVYVDLASYSTTRCSNGFYEQERTQLFDNQLVVEGLNTQDMAQVNNRQLTLNLDITVSRPERYVLVLLYYTQVKDKVQELEVLVDTDTGSDRGTLRLPGCGYSSLCRQPVLDAAGNVKEFTFNYTTGTITLTGRPGFDIALDSVYAIPVSQWTLDHVTPKLACIRKDGQCIPGTFITPAGTIRVDFESSPNEPTDDVPPSITDLSVKVVKLDRVAPTVSIRAASMNPGRFVFVVHYYQPSIVGFDVDVKISSVSHSYVGTLKAGYCPSVSGCRGVVRFKDAVDMQTLDISDQDIRISFNSSRTVWLDYILLIPSEQFQTKVLDVLDVDKSAEFISKCGSNDFYINSSATSFCREAVYSLTTDYNNGALRCQCNPDGSSSFKCEEFGGQCRCKPNVIGRTCSHCRTGYYGFPNCRQCNCPSGLCDPSTGRCMCPPKVTGPNCDVCATQTFGYDPLIGCEDCLCDPSGVVNNNMNCDINSGQCACKPNVAGRRCNTCNAGFAGFPLCRKCSCDENGGVTADICDQQSGTCLCKANVEGAQCTSCKPSTFFLEERNPKGCSQCFCFGITTRCEQSQLRRTQISSMSDWGLTNLRNPVIQKKGNVLEVKIESSDVINRDEPIYWIAPASYLGNQVTSYGGKLTYTVRFQIPRGEGSSGVVASDVRIEGNNFTIVHTSMEQPSPGNAITIELDMLESKFVHETKSSSVSREQFMTVLSRINVLHIRASYYSLVSKITLSDVKLDIATATGRGEVAQNVEQCECPPNYIGTSCEQCAPGFYRSKQGAFLGTCVPCQCNNRADICDPDSGSCHNCKDNFEGPQCMACKRGYYYDDYLRVCKICACPMTIDSNNFAFTCEVNRDGSMRQCQCMKGYTGPRCETCEIGYWGNALEPGNRCQKCQCSGNIDVRDPLSCDRSTGQCLKCIAPSAGDQCERCTDWHYGDAVTAKNCQECACDKMGSAECDHQTGECICKPNVIGSTCNECAPGHFGFESGNGCSSCDCASGSVGAECDVISGQCRCRPGVTGRRCDQCQANFWNYGPRGCEPCRCTGRGAVTCDQTTGACQCMPGHTGPNCDTCLPRWVMIPEFGCQECDNCVHLLVDDSENLERNVSLTIRDLNSISVGMLALRRLERINSTIRELRPRVDRLTGTPTDPTSLDPIKRDLESIQRTSDSVNIKADRVHRESELVESDSSDVKIRAEELYEKIIREAIDSANGAVLYVRGILGDIQSNIGQTNVAELLRQAQEMIREMRERNFDAKDRETNEEMDYATEALRKAKELLDKATEQANRTKSLTIRIEEISMKLNDLRDNSRISMDQSAEALRRNTLTRRTITEILEIVKDINIIEKEIDSCHGRARQLLDDARRFLNDARLAYKQVEEELSRLDVAIQRLTPFVDNLETENARLRPLVENATEHAKKLKQQADLLDSLISDTRDSAEGAVNASNAYQSIIDMINKAWNASEKAIEVADEANILSAGHADEAMKAKERSDRLRTLADDTIRRLNQDIKPRLVMVNTTIKDISTIVIEVRDDTSDINLLLDTLPERGYGEEARQAAEKAMIAQTKAEEAQSKVQTIVDRLPDDQLKVEQIPRDIDVANRNIRDTQSQVSKVQDLVPQAIELLNRLRLQADRIRRLGDDLKGNISRLRSDVSIARNHANLLKVGMSFNSGSQLWVQNPPNLQQSGSYSKVSLYFRTDQPDGLLLFIGPDVGPKVVDYMALEIIGGQVVFKFDLGSGAAIITSTKVVNDGKWHEVIAERTGKTGKLTVRSDKEEDDVQTGVSQGGSSILDLDYNTKFFVGGVLSKDVDTLTPDVLTNAKFFGCLADIKFNDVAFGLWNFMEAYQVNGCRDRDELQEQLPRSIRFGGNGYVILSKGNFKPTTLSAVRFKFRTFNPEGLMFLMGHGKDYFSVEMKDGKVVSRYDLGSGSAILSSAQNSQQNYNDGKWHSLYMNRRQNDGILKIDDVTVASGRSPGSMSQLEIDNEIYIGGFKGTHNYALVTQKGFEGCIKDVQLGQTPKDINENIEIKDIQQGCSEVARLVSFTHDVANSYVALSSVNIEQTFQMSMTIKSLEKDGLIFYVADNATQSNAMSISLVGGKIVVMVVANGQRTTLETTRDDYNDGRWHYLTVTKDLRNLQLDIDDIEILKTKITSRDKATTTSYCYFGGVPSNYGVITNNVGSSTSFVGCISDVNINDNAQNFAEVSPSNMVGAILASCHIADPTPSPRPVTISFTPQIPVIPTGLPPEKCRLPLEPQLPDTVATEGIRFGLSPDSRYEYATLGRNNASGTELKIDFKTSAANATIFYVASDRSKDFIALYLKNGQVGFAFDCGSGTGRGITQNQYNDGRWHSVTFARSEKVGTLTVDDDTPVQFTSRGRLKTIEVVEPYYLGGLPKDIVAASANNLDGVKSRFVGCLRNFKQDNVAVAAPALDVGTEPCHAAAEQGIFFYSAGGHLVLYDNYSVPLDFRLELEIKPRTMSGVIFSIYNHGTGPPGGDFLVLQMINGSMVFSMDNGRGERKSEYQPSSKNELCNGQWHTIAALKTKNVVSLEVDGVHTSPGIGIEGVAHTNTRDPVYFGGVPELHRGIKTRDQYVGCIRRLVFNGVPVNLNDARSFGKVNLSACPTT